MAIQSTSLTLGQSNIYVSSGNTVVSVMYFCNQNSAAANLNVWVVGNGSVAGGNVSAANLVYREVPIAAADTYVVDLEKLVLANGDYIKANSGGTVNATISYVGI
jgi:hypothetical protein